MENNLIVLDVAFEGFFNNQLFDIDVAKNYPGASVWPKFKSKMDKLGYQCVTGDVFLNSFKTYDKVYVVSEMITPNTKEIRKRDNVTFFCIFSGESPNVATSFYKCLGKNVMEYEHAFLFNGFKKKVIGNTSFHPFHWPNNCMEMKYKKNWEDKRFLVMISSNKSRLSVSNQKAFPPLRRFVKYLYLEYLKKSNITFNFTDLYEERIAAITYFCDNGSFDLFGGRWQNTGNMSKSLQRIIRKLNPVTIEDKISTLSNYKFSICFENCVYPGYITEKIFDCFFAGCIPVYYGAPDITDYVPKDIFIDFRDFKSYKELDEYLKNMSPGEYEEKINKIKDYLSSSQFKSFTDINFVETISSMLN